MAEEDKELEEIIMKRAIELTEQHKAQMSDRLYKNTVEQIKEKAKRGRPAKKKETAQSTQKKKGGSVNEADKK